MAISPSEGEMFCFLESRLGKNFLLNWVLCHIAGKSWWHDLSDQSFSHLLVLTKSSARLCQKRQVFVLTFHKINKEKEKRFAQWCSLSEYLSWCCPACRLCCHHRPAFESSKNAVFTWGLQKNQYSCSKECSSGRVSGLCFSLPDRKRFRVRPWCEKIEKRCHGL